MSKGNPIPTKYQDQYDSAKIHSIVVQKQTPTLAIGAAKNDPTSLGDATEKGLMTVSKTSRRRGKRPMTATFKWKETAPDGYDPNGRISLPLLTNEIQQAIAKATKKVTEGSYMGQPVIYLNKRDQDID